MKIVKPYFYPLIVLAIFLAWSKNLNGQNPGEWTWVHGVKTMNFMGTYGIKGTASPTNKPPGIYEGIEFCDNQNNFWIFGGEGNGHWYDNLWHYNVSTNMWTWLKGSQNVEKPTSYGIQGVPSITNTPGERVNSQSWTDLNGNFWLYGGVGFYGIGTGCDHADLWKYDITTNLWVYVNGEKGAKCGGSNGVHGTMGVEDSLSHPGHSTERSITWVDKTNNLWMLDDYGCMWRYRINTNNWTWMNGDTNGVAIYGQKGVPSLNNHPGMQGFSYTRWKDSKDNFWFLYKPGGSSPNNQVLFKYNNYTNMWTWVWGDTVYTYNLHYNDTLCDYSFDSNIENIIPYPRIETRTCWTDNCDNLWLMGGFGFKYTYQGDLNDLIYFDTTILKWIWAGNDTIKNYIGNYGTMGIESPNNKPPSRAGALPFKDIDGNLWLYGGVNDSSYKYYGDLWRYQMDNGCPPCKNPFVSIDEKSKGTSIIISQSNNKILINNLTSHSIVTIYDLLGKLIRKELNNTEPTLEFTNLNGGMYLVAIDCLTNEFHFATKVLLIE